MHSERYQTELLSYVVSNETLPQFLTVKRWLEFFFYNLMLNELMEAVLKEPSCSVETSNLSISDMVTHMTHLNLRGVVILVIEFKFLTHSYLEINTCVCKCNHASTN